MESNEQLVLPLKRLTHAIWALVIVLAALLVFLFVIYLPWLRLPWNQSSFPSPFSAFVTSTPELADFHAMPLARQIEAASVVAISRFEQDADRRKCVIAEVLKQAPGTTFHYKSGDEFHPCSQYSKANEFLPDGQLMFFTGNPASFRFSTSIKDGRVTGLGDMPIEALRKEIAKANPN